MVMIRTVCQFEAGHRQFGDPSKCGFLHGHNWKAEIEINSPRVNDIGYVVDFKNIKDEIKNAFDHKVILNMYDPLVQVLLDNYQRVQVVGGNPTCEVLAKKIKSMIYELVHHIGITDTDITVVLWENGDCYARE